MDNEPNYLDISEELYPDVTVEKLIVLENDADGFFCQITTRLAYDSYAREMDLTDAVAVILAKSYTPHDHFEIYIYDELAACYISVGFLPHATALRVGEQFLQAETLFLKVKLQEDNFPEEDLGEQIALSNPMTAGEKKIARKKTIEEILILASQWRKLQIKHNFKLTFTEAADLLGVSRRSLQDYISLIKLAEKYNFPFEQNLQERVSQLRKFVKEKHETKKDELLPILAKFMNSSSGHK